jgi:toxin FitB
MMILDTNVLSALMSREPDKRVILWLDKQPRTSIWTTSVTVLEVRFGLRKMPAGKRCAALMQAFETVLSETIDGRIASFDAAAARFAGDLMAIRHKKGRPGDLRDTMIAGIVLASQATLATRNTSHFEDLSVPVVNPWTGAAPVVGGR